MTTEVPLCSGKAAEALPGRLTPGQDGFPKAADFHIQMAPALRGKPDLLSRLASVIRCWSGVLQGLMISQKGI